MDASVRRRSSVRTAAIVLAVLAIPVLMVTLDPAVGRHTVTIDETRAVDGLVAFTNPLGRVPLVAGVGVVLLFLGAVRRSAWWARLGVAVLLTLAACGGATYAVKVLVRRPRPWAAAEGLTWRQTLRDSKWCLNGQAHSFPSGDVTCAAGLATVAFLALRRGRARYLVALIPLLSSLGRIVDARHYPSDCLGGLLLGMAMAALVWRVMKMGATGPPGVGDATAATTAGGARRPP